jgi:FkbM family methyltransferase
LIRQLIARARDQYRLAKLLVGPLTQVAEELVLFRDLFWPLRRGVLLDVGAHWGNSLKPYALRGWSVYALEPDPENRRRLVSEWSRFPSVIIDGRAVSQRDGETLPLFTSPVSTGISALAPFHPSHKPTSTATTVRLATFCAEHRIDHIDFLKVDVEGFDLLVLKSHDWQRLRPSVVMCEYEDRKTAPLGHTSSATAAYLANLGYRIVVSEWHPISEYGAHHRWRRAYRANDESIPGDSWGNLIAVSTAEQEVRLLRAFARMSRKFRS